MHHFTQQIATATTSMAELNMSNRPKDPPAETDPRDGYSTRHTVRTNAGSHAMNMAEASKAALKSALGQQATACGCASLFEPQPDRQQTTVRQSQTANYSSAFVAASMPASFVFGLVFCGYDSAAAFSKASWAVYEKSHHSSDPGSTCTSSF
ncbi:hypothetical protein P280DRAFT_476194 [Massarina eburnea CBS 473.64]|uniref:Uncharacterized protein n=1 Tax=Massarina eburnea CBS 473.64 TaxID=1395130 RepID=A0A6A6SHG5_9PLEO|nr:hypothetical protein P280DRAFT_476194 [Massarina eburnea CBS 473.64]